MNQIESIVYIMYVTHPVWGGKRTQIRAGLASFSEITRVLCHRELLASNESLSTGNWNVNTPRLRMGKDIMMFHPGMNSHPLNSDSSPLFSFIPLDIGPKRCKNLACLSLPPPSLHPRGASNISAPSLAAHTLRRRLPHPRNVACTDEGAESPWNPAPDLLV